MSLATEQALGMMRSDPIAQMRRAENFVVNASRVVEALGQMKGAAMKVGQMLSLHEGMLPPEVAQVLSALQQEAPRVPFEVMEFEARAELDNFDEVFASIEPEAFAAASIGQVHKGRLKDGREVAVKIQYPEIERMVKADLKNMKTLFGSLVAMISEVDFEQIWEEVRDRLVEELDYETEASHMRAMADLYRDRNDVLIPRVVAEASAKRVLTMEFVGGIAPDEACSAQYPQALKDRWGQGLFEFTMRGLFQHGLLHADPNFANFAFREDGHVVVYDYGCMKRIEPGLAAGYAGLFDAVIRGDQRAVPERLKAMGVYKQKTGTPIAQALIDPIFDVAGEIVRAAPPYRFGDDSEIYESLFEIGRSSWAETTDYVFPRDIIFIDRTLGGLFGNLGRLQAAAPWRELLEGFVQPLLATDRVAQAAPQDNMEVVP
jgi:predicted unusual protein kinase regulating ubiquinone biosynthesis (AarF/ABC1/UbiB family)